MSYRSAFQGGPYFELLSTQGRETMVNWKEPSSGIKKLYEKEVKGYILTLEGSPATTKLQYPKDQKQSVTLVQRFLVLQLYLLKGADFCLELGVTDLGNNKRRIVLSTAQKETQVTPLHAKFPLAIVKRGVWLNLVVDLVSFVGEAWTNQTFRSVEQISISANSKLRRVFTMKSQPPDTTDDDELYGCSNTNSGELDAIPKQCQMTPGVIHQTQVLTLNKIRCAERLRSAKGPTLAEQIRPGSILDLDLSISGRKAQVSDGNKIAFGSKAPRVVETSRRSSRQSVLTVRTNRSQAPQNENNSGSADVLLHEKEIVFGEIPTTGFLVDPVRPKAPLSAGAALPLTSLSPNVYSRQQSQPVSHDDFGHIASVLKEKQFTFQQPHPPREPSSDRVRRRPRIKSLGHNGVLGRGEANFISPPTSGQLSSRVIPQSQQSSASSGVVGAGDLHSPSSATKDSGVGPDVPEIQSPRKSGQPVNHVVNPAYSDYDSVADVISLLAAAESTVIDSLSYSGPGPKLKYDAVESERKGSAEKNGARIDRKMKSEHLEKKLEQAYGADNEEDSDNSVSSSGSSHPAEYEESDEEPAGDSNKLHFFASPPKSAGVRKVVSPALAGLEDSQLPRNSVATSLSNIKRSETSSSRGARLEDDFISNEDDPTTTMEMIHHQFRLQRLTGEANHPHSHHRKNHNHSRGQGQASSFSTSKLKASQTTKSKTGRIFPKASVSPNQRPSFDPKQYSDHSDSGQDIAKNPVSRMSRKSLREIHNPMTASSVNSDKPYDRTKYQPAEVTESFEAGMLASMAREAEDELEDVHPPATSNLIPIPHSATSSYQPRAYITEPTSTHLYSESPATTSDDDTSFSTWKAPALNQTPHNYQDEMKSRRSSDTMTSSNPRDWSGVMSPPIGPLTLAGDRNLEGTMEGISDFPEDAATAGCQDRRRKGLKREEEEEKLDLLFDPKLNCYYDPKSKKWYELVS